MENIDITNKAYTKFYNLMSLANDTTKNIMYGGSIAKDIDFDYLSKKYWKFDKFGSLNNTWCMLFLGVNDITSAFNPSIWDNTESSDYKYIIMHGVSIDISASPIVIETRVKGTDGPIYQTFGSSNYDVNISYLESGPTFWQQNSKQIIKLVTILNSGKKISLISPQLNIIYKIDSLICTNYSIGQDPRFYSHNNISISFKSDKTQDILVPQKNS